MSSDRVSSDRVSSDCVSSDRVSSDCVSNLLLIFDKETQRPPSSNQQQV